MKTIAPFIVGHTGSKMWFNVIFQSASFLLTGFSSHKLIAYTGVVCASLASGLGEATLLGHMAKFDSNMISTWSSGTGAAGFFGALSYMALTALGMTPRNTILTMLVIPVTMWVSFFCILVPPSELTDPLLHGDRMVTEQPNNQRISVKEKLRLLKVRFSSSLFKLIAK
jgi:battenin